MFEKLLEKLIATYLGDYIKGIDKNKLHVGVWSGNIVIEDVELNEEKINSIISKLKLPFDLMFSSLGRLNMIVPWKKLSSAPVEISIRDIYLILRLREIKPDFNIKEFLESKKSLVMNYCKYILNKSINEDTSSSYLNKLFTKIIDNMQLNIQNIHIRIEGGDPLEEIFYDLDQENENNLSKIQHTYKNKPYSFGFCIHAISVYTTDPNWVKKFIDRSIQMKAPIRKKIEIKQISFYWQESNMINMNISKKQCQSLMNLIIRRKQKRLLSIDGQILLIKNLGAVKPRYQITTKFQQLKLQMNYLQLKEILELGQLILQFKNIQKFKKKFESSKQEQLKFEPIFNRQFLSAYEKNFKDISPQFQQMLIKVEKKLLLDWTMLQMKEIIKKTKIAILQKQKNKKTFWGTIIGATEVKITEQEQSKIDTLIEQFFIEDDPNNSNQQAPWYKIVLEIEKGNISVIHKQLKQLINLTYSNMKYQLLLSKNSKKYKFELSLGDIQMNYLEFDNNYITLQKLFQSNKNSIQQIKILRKINKHENFLQLKIFKDSSNTIKITLFTQKLEINHQIKVISFIKEIMTLRTSQEIKSAAWNRMVELKKTQNINPEVINHTKTRLRLNVQIKSIYLIINLDNKDKIYIYFDQLKINDQDEVKKIGKLESLNILYSISHLPKESNSKDYFILKNFSPVLNLQVQENQNIINIKLSNVQFHINNYHTNNIQKFLTNQASIFKNMVTQQKEISLQNCYKFGKLKILTIFKSWKQYEAIFTGGYIELYESQMFKPQLRLYIKNAKIIKLLPTVYQFKIQSEYINQIIECVNEIEYRDWISILQQKIIQLTTNQELFQMIEQKNQSKQYTSNLIKQTFINATINSFKFYFQKENQTILYLLTMKQVFLKFKQNQYFFERQLSIEDFQLKDCELVRNIQQYTDFNSIICSSTRCQTIKDLDRILPEKQFLNIFIEGKKKAHPNYKGELAINVTIGQLKINFNPAFILKIIDLFSSKQNKSRVIAMSPGQRENIILEKTKRFVESKAFLQRQINIENSKSISDKNMYRTFNKYEENHHLLLLIKMKFQVKSARINFLHRATLCCNAALLCSNLKIEINKAERFLFVNVDTQDATLYDVSNYPKTIHTLTHQKQIKPYPILQPKNPGKKKSTIEFSFASFDQNVFVNKDKINSFIYVKINEYILTYQQQPFMRFIDYLNNQLISFLLNPQSLLIYQNLMNKQFKFSQYVQMTEKELQKMIQSLLMPNFNNMLFELNDVLIHFNSHPYQQKLNILVDKIIIENINELKKHRIYKIDKQIQRFSKKPYFNDLRNNQYFQERILNNCWIQTFNISLHGATLQNHSQKFTLDILFERLPNQERVNLYPFLNQNKKLVINGRIPELQLYLDRKYYNLIVKCMIHNLTYDDGKQSLYQHNFQHTHLMQFSDIQTLIKIQNFKANISEIEELLSLKGFEFWFLRDLKMEKKILVKSKKIELIYHDELVVGELLSQRLKQQKIQQLKKQKYYELDYEFSSQKNYDKSMSVRITNLFIYYKLEAFTTLGSFTIIQQDCFPKSDVLSDLPLIVCNVTMKNTRIILIRNEDNVYYGQGDINFIWNRNRMRNHEVLIKERSNNMYIEEIGGLSTSYQINIRNFKLCKCLYDNFINRQISKENSRRLSGPINLFLRINFLIKFSTRNEIYYDKSFNYSIENVRLYLSFDDINQLMNSFKGNPSSPTQSQLSELKKSSEQIDNPRKPEIFNPNQIPPLIQHNFIIHNIQLQFLLSSPPAPLISLNITDCKLKLTQLNGITLHSKINLQSLYWNLKVGKWEPIIEKTTVLVEIQWGKTKYLRLQSSQLMINLSVQAIKILKIFVNDINKQKQKQLNIKSSLLKSRNSEQNKQQKKGIKIENISPYLIKNNTGCLIEISSQNGVTVALLPSEQTNYKFQTIDIQRDVSESQSRKVQFTIKQGKQFIEIPGINLDKVKNTVMRIQCENRQFDVIFIAQYREIVKQITISSSYIIRNMTEFDIIFGINDKDIKILKGQQQAIPYNIYYQKSIFKLNFTHLEPVQQNFSFESNLLEPNYQHYILTTNGYFNANLQIEESIRKIIKITPVFIFKNALPSVILIEIIWKLKNGNNKIIEYKLGVQQEKGFHEIGSKDLVEIRVKMQGFQFSKKTKLYDPKDKSYIIKNLQFSDYRGEYGSICVRSSKKNRVKKYTFFTQAFFINQSSYDLYCFNNSQLIPGQKIKDIPQTYTKICLLERVEKAFTVSLGVNQPNCNFSQPILLKELGNSTIQVTKDRKLCEIGLYIGMYCVDNQQDIYTAIIQATPKYIIINKCIKNLQIRQSTSEYVIQVQSLERVPLEWQKEIKNTLINIKLVDKENQWLYSENINIKDNKSIVSFALRSSKDLNKRTFMRLETVKEFQYNYIIIQEIKQEKDYLIYIENNLRYIRLNIYQSIIDKKNPHWAQHKGLEIRETQKKQYGLDYPNQSKELTVDLNFAGPLRADYDDTSFTIDLNQQTLHEEKTVQSSQTGRQYTLTVVVQIVGAKSVIKFNQKQENMEEQQTQQFVVGRYGISLKNIGISLIGENQNKRCEILFLTLQEFQFMILEKAILRTIQLKIKYINIDNNSNHNTSNPVLFTPAKYRNTFKSLRSFFVLLIQQNLKQKSINQIKSIRIAMLPTSIKIDDDLIQKVFEFIKKTNNNNIAIEQTNLKQLLNQQNKYCWEINELKNLQSETFIQEFEIANFTLIISFSMRPRESASNLLVYHILSSFGVALSKISQSPLNFSHLLLNSKNSVQIKKELAQYYRSQFFKGVYKIVGSFNIIGSPYSLIRYYGQGLVDVVEHPIQGFIKGPIEGIFGIFTGSLGLFKNVIAGTFNSLQSFTESISSMFSSLSMDQKFIQRREKIKNSPTRHIFSGLKEGGFSIITGFQLAITGIYRQPTQGYRQNGFLGGVTGSLKAVTGLLTKPLSGIFEGISKTSAGVKNTALIFQDGPKISRERPPRIFYGEEGHFKEYHEEQASIIAFLELTSTKYLNLTILEIITIQNELDYEDIKYFVVSTTYLFLVDLENKKIQWDYLTYKVKKVENIPNSDMIKIEILDGQQITIRTKNKQSLYQKLLAVTPQDEQLL